MMTTELVLLIFIYATVLLGVFMKGPRETFRSAAPKLASKIERNIATGREFTDGGKFPIKWVKPQ